MPTRKAEAEWKGNLAAGSGRLKVGSGAFDGPYSFKSRFEEGQSATNPEDLIGSTHPAAGVLICCSQLRRRRHRFMMKARDQQAKSSALGYNAGFDLRGRR